MVRIHFACSREQSNKTSSSIKWGKYQLLKKVSRSVNLKFIGQGRWTGRERIQPWVAVYTPTTCGTTTQFRYTDHCLFSRRTQGVPSASQRVLRGHAAAPQWAPSPVVSEPQRLRCDARHRLAPRFASPAFPVPGQPARRGGPEHTEVTWCDPSPQRDLPPPRLPRGLRNNLQTTTSLRLGAPKPKTVLRGGVRLHRWVPHETWRNSS